jgi:hypothetical protein
MSLQPRSTYSFDDYLTTERTLIDERHEYIDGQVVAMTGASWEHNVISANLTAKLHTQLAQGPCTVLSNDLRVRIETANAGTYPDVAVLCDAPAYGESVGLTAASASAQARLFLLRGFEHIDMAPRFADRWRMWRAICALLDNQTRTNQSC